MDLPPIAQQLARDFNGQSSPGCDNGPLVERLAKIVPSTQSHAGDPIKILFFGQIAHAMADVPPSRNSIIVGTRT